MIEQFILDFLQQFDIASILEELSELDWLDFATYTGIALAAGGTAWLSAQTAVKQAWNRVEKPVGFLISTFVVLSLWYALLRVHVSISFNLDKEVFDDCIYWSVMLFTPYYLIHYGLVRGFFLTIGRTVELLVDLFVLSWFPEKAEQNRNKWGKRFNGFRERIGTAIETKIQRQ